MWFETGKNTGMEIPVEYVTTDAGLARCVEWCESRRDVAVDTETSGLNPRVDKIATIQVGNLERAWVIDVRCVSANALGALCALLNRTDRFWFGQNLRFEYRFLRFHYNVRLRSVVDTQLAECIARTGLLNWASVGGKVSKWRKKSRAFSLEAEDEEKVKLGAYGLTSMGHLARHYLGVEIDKDKSLRTGFYSTPAGRHNDRQLHYAAGDVVYPFLIFQHQRELLKARKLTHVFRAECDVLSVVGEMEHQGMRVDSAAWLKLYQEAVVKRRTAQGKLDSIFLGMNNDLFGGRWSGSRPLHYGLKQPKELNYDAAAHVQWAIKHYCDSIRWTHEIVVTEKRRLELLKEYAGEWIDAINKRAAENGEKPRDLADAPDHLIPEDQYCVLVSTDKGVLKLAAARKQLPRNLVELLLDFSKQSQLVSSFGAEWLRKLNPTTGRMHPDWHQAMTQTGRLSSSPNLQQIPKGSRYRKCFIPRKGFKYVLADYSQQEPRLLAFASQDPGYVQVYLDADDLYCRVGENMLGIRPEKGSAERDMMKAVVLAKAYRSGIAKLRDQLTLALYDRIMAGEMEPPTMQYAKHLDTRFYEAFPGIKDFQNKCSDQADPKKGEKLWDDLCNADVTFIRDPSGRMRMFPPGAIGTYTEAPNMICQGASATMTKVAAALFQAALFERGWEERCFIVNLVHDEILAEAEDEIAQECAYLLQECMIKAAEKFCPTIPFVAEFPEHSTGVMPYWGKSLEVELALAA